MKRFFLEKIRKSGKVVDFSDKSLVWQGLLGVVLIGIMFFSGFISLGTYILGFQNDSFVNRAVTTSGKVIDVRVHSRVEKTKSANGRTSSRTYNDHVLLFEFLDDKGNVVQSRLNSGPRAVYSKGDTTEILYDPTNPKNIMLLENRDKSRVLEKISNITFYVFIASLVAFVLFGKRRTERL